MKICVIDTGCNYHDFFKDKNINFIDDNCWHGTQVVSVLLQVNPNAEILNFKAFNDRGKSNVVKVLKGFDYAIENKCDMVLMANGTMEDNGKLHKGIKGLRNKGIYVISAIGNKVSCETYPAKYDDVISVGALGLNGKVARFSPRNADVYAQGINNNCVWKNNSWTKNTGTSLASAKICGLASLLLEEYMLTHKKKPSVKQFIKLINKELNRYVFF